jgi:phosphohistidine phosphatase SixA
MAAPEPSLSGRGLIDALRGGGYVLLMRHASSPMQPPEAKDADPENLKGERQLDESGRRTAKELGDAFRALQIPVGRVYSSPAYRAVETIRLAGFGRAMLVAQLAVPEQHNMAQAASDSEPITWLRLAVKEPPSAKSNTLIVTHAPNIMGAFPESGASLSDGEMLVFGKVKGAPHLLARVKIEEWPRLASSP